MDTGANEQGANAEGGPAARAAAFAETLAATWNFSDPGQSESRFPQLAEQLAQQGDRSGQLQALTQVARAPTRIAAWCVARALRALGRIEEALQQQTELARQWEAAGSSSGYVFEELGECLLAQAQPELAAPQFARAHALLAKDAQFVHNNAARFERIGRLAEGGEAAAG